MINQQTDPEHEHYYIFGYGSLINSHSRRITGIAGDSIPVRAQGLQRYWVSFGNYPMRSVGVVTKQDGLCNGVIFEVPATQILLFDEREVGYLRQALDPTALQFLDDDIAFNPKQPVWVYMYQDVITTTPQQPISQAYLDVILLGCLETSTDFAREFLQHTLLWQNWHNDRDNPRYPRAIQHEQGQQLDILIAHEGIDITQRY